MTNGPILIVEDNADIRDSLVLLLQEEGFSVIAAEDCTSGFEQLLKQQPSLVITDVMLPDYSGLQFIRWTREQMGGDTPIIAMSAYEQGYLVAAMDLGADATIHKPEELDHLTETIQAVLAGKAQRQDYVPAEEPSLPPEDGYVN